MNTILKVTFPTFKTIQRPAIKSIGRVFIILSILITVLFAFVHHRASAASNPLSSIPVSPLPVTGAILDDNLFTLGDCTGLTIDKQATPETFDNVGDVISYSYLVQNTSNLTFAGPVTVTDDKVPVSCPSGGLAPNATMTCSASYIITQADLDFGSVTNTAFASADGKTSDVDEETVVVNLVPALSLVKTAAPSTYANVGDVILYSYLVKNTGNVTFTGPVTVTDDKVPASCPSGGLAPGATMTCSASYAITQADLDSGSVTNTAFASADGKNSDVDEETVVANRMPALSLVKTATPLTYANVGDVILYSYLVKNTGNVIFTGPVTVTDDKVPASCPSGGLAPGATMTCSASYTITQADLDSGSVTNTAFATTNGTTSNMDAETVNHIKLPQTITFTSAAPVNAIVGWVPYTPSASSTSGLPVSITVDAAASSVCSISGGIVSFIGVGTCLLDANQQGNLLYEAAPQVQQSFDVIHRWLIFLPLVNPPITINPPVPPTP